MRCHQWHQDEIGAGSAAAAGAGKAPQGRRGRYSTVASTAARDSELASELVIRHPIFSGNREPASPQNPQSLSILESPGNLRLLGTKPSEKTKSRIGGEWKPAGAMYGVPLLASGMAPMDDLCLTYWIS